jgi:(2Fe-2S) ferredoxin
MKDSRFVPARAQLFVCVNRRAPDDPLGGGCSVRGEAVYDALRTAIEAAGQRSAVWLAKTYCLGICPKVGCCVAISPGKTILTEVTPDDVPAVLAKVPR